MSERRRSIEAQFRARPPHAVSTRKGPKSGSASGAKRRHDDELLDDTSPLLLKPPPGSRPTPINAAQMPRSRGSVGTPSSSTRRPRPASRAPDDTPQAQPFGVDPSDADAADAWAQLINAAAAADGQPEAGHA
eukprot:1146538-Prymnesium_polylepis.1